MAVLVLELLLVPALALLLLALVLLALLVLALVLVLPLERLQDLAGMPALICCASDTAPEYGLPPSTKKSLSRLKPPLLNTA